MLNVLTANEAIWNYIRIWGLSWIIFLIYIYNEIRNYRKTEKCALYRFLVESGTPVGLFGRIAAYIYLISVVISIYIISFLDDAFFIPWKILIPGTIVNYAICWTGLSLWAKYYLTKHNLKPVDKVGMQIKQKQVERQKKKHQGKD